MLEAGRTVRRKLVGVEIAAWSSVVTRKCSLAVGLLPLPEHWESVRGCEVGLVAGRVRGVKSGSLQV